jgi:2-keto-4-pentenoate hydratase/2-oxohepta-3-ene-1,7-dioic acid hydratase in catechol pathway
MIVVTDALPRKERMRLVSFSLDGEVRLGAELDGDIVDLNRASAAVPTDILAFLEGGATALERAREALDLAASRPEVRLAAAGLELLPPVPRPPKIICVARNYGAHAAEAGVKLLEFPNLFIRFAQSLIPDGAPILVPKVSHEVDWEAELAVIIGRSGKHVPASEALDHVAGYSIFNDVSVRDWQLRVPQFGAGKNFDGSGPFGPALVTADEIPDPQALPMRLTINGEEMQSASTADMVFSIAELIEHISQFTTLEPGDVIATGTPAGVGFTRKPPRFLVPGDTVRIEIEGVGVLENPVEAEV